jgi:hypothetical protein
MRRIEIFDYPFARVWDMLAVPPGKRLNRRTP